MLTCFRNIPPGFYGTKMSGEEFLRHLSFDADLRTSLLTSTSTAETSNPNSVAEFFAKATDLEQNPFQRFVSACE